MDNALHFSVGAVPADDGPLYTQQAFEEVMLCDGDDNSVIVIFFNTTWNSTIYHEDILVGIPYGIASGFHLPSP